MEIHPDQMVRALITNTQAKHSLERVLIAQLLERTARPYDQHTNRGLMKRISEKMLLLSKID